MFSCLEQMDAIKGRRGELLAGVGCQTPKNELKTTSRRQPAGTPDISIFVQCQEVARRSFCWRPRIHNAAVQKQFSVPSDKCYKSPKSHKRSSAIKQPAQTPNENQKPPPPPGQKPSEPQSQTPTKSEREKTERPGRQDPRSRVWSHAESRAEEQWRQQDRDASRELQVWPQLGETAKQLVSRYIQGTLEPVSTVDSVKATRLQRSAKHIVVMHFDTF